MQTTKWTNSGIMRKLATPRSRMTAMLVGAVLIAFSLALLAIPAPAVSRVADQAESLANERKAEHQWLAERNAALANAYAQQRQEELKDSWLERRSGTSANAVDPAVQSVLDYLHVHARVDISMPAQAVPDAAVQSVADYLRVHANVDSPVNSQAVPDAAVQSVSDYLAVHARVDAVVPAMSSERNARLLQVNESWYPSQVGQPRFYAPCCDPTDR